MERKAGWAFRVKVLKFLAMGFLLIGLGMSLGLELVHAEEATPRREGIAERAKEFMRPYFVKILGEEKTGELLGRKRGDIQLPPFPSMGKKGPTTIDNDAALYANLHKVSSTPEKEKKYFWPFLQELYQAVFQKEIEQTELEKWLNALQEGASREGIYRALVLGNEYFQLENYDDAPTDLLTQFTQEYMAKYVNVPMDKEALQKFNLYSIKRICVEKTLELMDVHSKKPQDLWDWYAVWSSEEAQRFPNLWKNSVRQNTSKEFHQRWAKSVPLEHIKSEVIIKLHTIFNSLK